jgi:acyl-[acyl-carrier-protein]-phospholipid O-acyltransferase/long-chain-fatty-acid--[acyl-carrier-protein] ligase
MSMVTCANPLEFKKVVGLVREEGVTLVAGTPFFLRGYLKRSEPGDFHGVRLLIAGADKVPDSLRKGFREKHGTELYEGYGTTETSPVVSVNLPGANKPGSIGRPISGVSVKIADVDTQEELPRGEEGRILVRGELVMKGYLGDPEETERRIKEGWYDTGDMGMLDEDGFLWHRGRLRRFVKIGGEMISIVRTEDVLEDVTSDDVECCVIDIPDEVKGAQLVAAVSKEVDEKDVLKKMSERLPNIALPRIFVVLNELPKMGSGKIDFRATTVMVKEKLSV